MADPNPQNDPLIGKAESANAAVDAAAQARFADLTDLRRVIGGLLGLYGLILTVLGLGASDADIERAAGVNSNLWTGLALLVAAAVFIAWALLRPIGAKLAAETAARGPDAGVDGGSAGSSGARAAS